MKTTEQILAEVKSNPILLKAFASKLGLVDSEGELSLTPVNVLKKLPKGDELTALYTEIKGIKDPESVVLPRPLSHNIILRVIGLTIYPEPITRKNRTTGNERDIIATFVTSGNYPELGDFRGNIEVSVTQMNSIFRMSTSKVIPMDKPNPTEWTMLKDYISHVVSKTGAGVIANGTYSIRKAGDKYIDRDGNEQEITVDHVAPGIVTINVETAVMNRVAVENIKSAKELAEVM